MEANLRDAALDALVNALTRRGAYPLTFPMSLVRAEVDRYYSKLIKSERRILNDRLFDTISLSRVLHIAERLDLQHEVWRVMKGSV